VHPASNVVFAAQGDLSKLQPAADLSVSPDLLTSTYGLPFKYRRPGKAIRFADSVRASAAFSTAVQSPYGSTGSNSCRGSKRRPGSVQGRTDTEACSASHDVYGEKEGRHPRSLSAMNAERSMDSSAPEATSLAPVFAVSLV